MCKREQSTSDDGSTLALKSTGRVNLSPKQRVPVTPQNGELSPQQNFVNPTRLLFEKHNYMGLIDTVCNGFHLGCLMFDRYVDIRKKRNLSHFIYKRKIMN